MGLSGRVTTAFVERVNLTLRRGVAGLARRTWATARTAPGLLAQVEWWRAYYHWVRPHRGLREAPGTRPRTPAMALGLTDHRWTVAELDRKSTRLNSSHANISYAVFCLKKKKTR